MQTTDTRAAQTPHSIQNEEKIQIPWLQIEKESLNCRERVLWEA